MAKTKTYKHGQDFESSIIESFYATNTGEGLVVTLQTGNTYSYPQATKELVEDFIVANSKGQFFSKNIRSLKSVEL